MACFVRCLQTHLNNKYNKYRTVVKVKRQRKDLDLKSPLKSTAFNFWPLGGRNYKTSSDTDTSKIMHYCKYVSKRLSSWPSNTHKATLASNWSPAFGHFMILSPIFTFLLLPVLSPPTQVWALAACCSAFYSVLTLSVRLYLAFGVGQVENSVFIWAFLLKTAAGSRIDKIRALWERAKPWGG